VKCLVTGATGLVGSHIVRALVTQGNTVRALARPTSDRSAISGLPLEIAIGDVLDPRTLRTAVKGCDVVFHAAAYFTYWGKTAEDLDRTALSGTTNVLKAAAAAGVPRVVVTSSSVVFGHNLNPIPLDEQSVAPDEPQTAYISSKVRQDRLALEKGRALKREVVLVCPTMVVGPFAPTIGPSNGVLSTYLEDPLRLTFPGGCNIAAASDVGRGHVLAALSGTSGERYILGGENLEWRAIHSLISDLCGTYGPLLPAGHAACYLAAFGEELRAQVSNRAPLTTRAQASMVGRYYWYTHQKAAKLGYRPIRAREAIAITLSWLVASAHLSRETRTRLRLSNEVWVARAALQASEMTLRARA
jgi:dihydroflavonol-4-reductase